MPAVQIEPWNHIALAIEELQSLMAEHLKMKLEVFIYIQKPFFYYRLK